ncbi:hypothetical protein C8R43DRAFT_1040710 [Mycena crocata]|nr:hypothetical protein C8R43DRAFT_1040710 [Mycena crocata]
MVAVTIAQTTTQQTTLVGRYPLAPTIIYLFLLYAYSLTAGGIYILAAHLRSPLFRTPGRRTTSAVQLAQLRLTDPLALVAALYPSNTDCATPEDARELFLEDENAPRLKIGVANDNTTGQPVFEVYRRVGPRSPELLEIR